MKLITPLLFCLLFSIASNAQHYFTGIASRWSDDLSEWNIYTWTSEQEEAFQAGEEIDPDEVEATGSLRVRWQMRDDWNTWDYNIGEDRGYIRTLFNNRPDQWEVVGFNDEVITIRQLWKGDLREWRITNNTMQLTLKARWGNRLDEWVVREASYGDFRIYTSWEGDPRDWTIVDELNEEVSTSMKMALIFLAVFNGSR